MTEQIWIGIVGFLLLIIQGLVAYYMSSINDKIKSVCQDNKEAHQDMWKRIYGHYHEVDCKNDECGRVKTGNVIVPHEGA
jgi:hypothetical protein